MKKWVFLFLTLPVFAFAKPIKTADDATDLVFEILKKGELTSLSVECVFIVENESENPQRWALSVYEKHDEKCGGDPETAPRLMSFEIEKRTGKAWSDAYPLAEKNGEEYWSGTFYPVN